MSMYGYSDALSQGTSFNARINNFNDGVLVHNQKLQDTYDAKVKAQPGKLAGDTRQKDEDEAFYGFKDGTGVLSAGVGVGAMAKGIGQKGFRAYAGDETVGRLNNIKSTARALVKGEPTPPPAEMELGEIGNDGKVVEGTAGRTIDQAAANIKTAKNLAGAGGQAVEQTAERESSGLMTAAIKKGLKVASAGKIGDAGLSALSEVGGKVIGDFSGGLDVGKSISNLVEGKNVFSGETTADKFQEAGAIADVAGIAFPPLEVLGGVLNITGGIMDAVTDLKGDQDQKNKDAAAPPPPKKTAVKVTPAFQSLGLVASSLPSAKSQIVGGGSF
jgi:hypothetical protein